MTPRGRQWSCSASLLQSSCYLGKVFILPSQPASPSFIDLEIPCLTAESSWTRNSPPVWAWKGTHAVAQLNADLSFQKPITWKEAEQRTSSLLLMSNRHTGLGQVFRDYSWNTSRRQSERRKPHDGSGQPDKCWGKACLPSCPRHADGGFLASFQLRQDLLWICLISCSVEINQASECFLTLFCAVKLHVWHSEVLTEHGMRDGNVEK